MATREKKLSVSRKPISPPPTPNEEITAPETIELPNTDHASEDDAPSPPKVTAASSPSKLIVVTPKKLVTRAAAGQKKKKAAIAIKLKPKMKKKIKPKLIKSLLNNPKNSEAKKLLLKTCKQVKPRKARLHKAEEPPILEPIKPIDDESDKAAKKKPGRPPRIDNYAKKIKIEPQTPRIKRVYRRKLKPEAATSGESFEDVMDDLNTLIKTGEEAEPKKRIVRRRKKELTLSTAERKVIDMLDLNVRQFQGGPVAGQRRHSIEKFQITASESPLFSNLPRCISPRSKMPRLRQSVETIKRANPYKTRSDSPVRILRNGKTRKLKDMELLKGLDAVPKRKRRNQSDFSSSEMSNSKLSGYESDSSYSDLSSVHGGLENSEVKDGKGEEHKENFDGNEFARIANSAKIIKRSLSADNTNYTDTNSNFCLSEKPKLEAPNEMDDANIAGAPSDKVPEKSLILGIMKQTFNDTLQENSKAKLELKTEPKEEAIVEKSAEVPVETEEEKATETDDVAEEEAPPAIINENGAVTTTVPEMDVDEEDVGADVENGPKIEESPENLAIKENILQALGLQSKEAAKEAKLNKKERSGEIRADFYTGTLKTVIKINRSDKKKGRNAMKMTLHKNKAGRSGDYDSNGFDDAYKILKDGPSTSLKHGGLSSDTAGAHRKSHYSNRSNLDGSSEHTSDGETQGAEGATKALVIPEKASSFSIHPGRLCKDECSYCFGKFGLFDTPCHIAQMKSVDRQNKILSTEKHLTTDSCLCDACYRHVDRKANTPSYTNKSYKRSTMVAPGPRQDHCHVLGCYRSASNILRRKWIIKMRKSITEVMNIDLDNPGLHSIPICDEHYSALEHLMVCAMCKRRLAKNHVHYLGPETIELNFAMRHEGVPLQLSDKPVVCKLCKCFAAILLKGGEERPENTETFIREYKKRLLHYNDIEPMDEAAAEEPIVIPTKDRADPPTKLKKRKLSQKLIQDMEKSSLSDQTRVPSSDSTVSQSRPSSPSDYMVDYNTLIPAIAMECGSSDSESKKEQSNNKKKTTISRPEMVKQAVEISKKLKSDKSSDIAVARLGSNPSISVRQLFPCEEDLPLQGCIEFGHVKERTPEGWEKCSSVIQYDLETKRLWQELQKPYGNQSSFLRHLILLEKYFRNGDLVLAPNASHHSINYHDSVQSRLKAYDNIATADKAQPITMIPFNKPQKSTSGIITSVNNNPPPKEPQIPVINAANIPKNTPLTISQLNSPPLLQPVPQTTLTPIQNKQKSIGAPPGLISLQPGTNKPVATPAAKPIVAAAAVAAVPAPPAQQQSQKIKFPITKNWRPNLIPIDVTKKNAERKVGLVQVISGGKPYHITLEDYKKMCAIKKSFELKQKRLMEQNRTTKNGGAAATSVLKSVAKKGLVISKSVASPKKEDEESALEKLDRQVERLGVNGVESKVVALPKIPKSLTVIPQTVARKPSRPSSPVLMITQKPKQVKS